MRTHAAIATICLAVTAALGGCADVPLTDDTFTLENAASMRVEAEVYKGPLSKTLPVQWGELEGLIDAAADSLESFGEVICQTINGRKSPDPGQGGKSATCWSNCESDPAAPGPLSRRTDIGDRILRGMYADTRCLLKEAESLRSVVRQHQPGSPGCRASQVSTVPNGPCSDSDTRTAGGAKGQTQGKDAATDTGSTDTTAAGAAIDPTKTRELSEAWARTSFHDSHIMARRLLCAAHRTASRC